MKAYLIVLCLAVLAVPVVPISTAPTNVIVYKAQYNAVSPANLIPDKPINK